ncbi:alpha-ribazole-5-phosphate synthase [Rummeliibacillus pycnus]|uniref:alpha-ribazole-5-phosphate synthase n=1 Tax=Rummeliibacillus pycnus TaxID=101070 RepID=UPI003D2A7447
MRNALQLSNGFIVTTDNSGAIGQKKLDVVNVPDDMTSYFSARVTLLEQWAEGAEPEAIILHNFSDEDAWQRYVAGISRLFNEMGMVIPRITGSTESNIKTMQSGIAVTMIGEPVKDFPPIQALKWFTYGKPLIGNELVAEPEKVANMKCIYEAIQQGIIGRIWPVGSKGISKEAQILFGEISFDCAWDIYKSAGPSTVVILGIYEEKLQQAKQFFGELLQPIVFKL